MEKASHIRLVFAKANRAIETVDRESIAHTGLHVTDFMILEALLHKGPMPINTIGKKVLLTSGSMTAAVNRLAGRGLIERVQDPLDGRRYLLNLTKTGLKLIRSAYRIHRENLLRIFDCLDEQERDEFIRLLKKVGHHAEQIEIS